MGNNTILDTMETELLKNDGQIAESRKKLQMIEEEKLKKLGEEKQVEEKHDRGTLLLGT